MSGTTEDALLGGRIRLRQPARGFRAGLDAVLLAAAVPAQPGERVMEAGCGSGAGFLCLAARVPQLRVVAVERNPEMAALARSNAAANGLADRVEVVEGDVADPALPCRIGVVDHAFANPPYWPGGTEPPDPVRRAATHLAGQRLSDWTAFLAAALRRRGTATLVLPAAQCAAGAAALLAAGCGEVGLLPLWPKAGQPARRVLLQARRLARGPGRMLPGLVLHGPGGGFTAEAEGILRDAAPLPFG
jgi:tRNA1(Val) A37 N6-methylase TrmN6